jgi:hypothetical protein
VRSARSDGVVVCLVRWCGCCCGCGCDDDDNEDDGSVSVGVGVGVVVDIAVAFSCDDARDRFGEVAGDGDRENALCSLSSRAAFALYCSNI